MEVILLSPGSYLFHIFSITLLTFTILRKTSNSNINVIFRDKSCPQLYILYYIIVKIELICKLVISFEDVCPGEKDKLSKSFSLIEKSWIWPAHYCGSHSVDQWKKEKVKQLHVGHAAGYTWALQKTSVSWAPKSATSRRIRIDTQEECQAFSQFDIVAKTMVS